MLAWNLSGIAAKLQTEGPDYVYLKAFLQELADNGIVYELQDNFFHFATASGDENKFQAKVEVIKHFGEVSLRLIAPGKAYNPLNDIEMTLPCWG